MTFADTSARVSPIRAAQQITAQQITMDHRRSPNSAVYCVQSSHTHPGPDVGVLVHYLPAPAIGKDANVFAKWRLSYMQAKTKDEMFS